MRPLWRFIRNKNNREMIGWLGGGLVILVAGAWGIFTYAYPPAGPPKPLTNVEARDGSIAIGGNVEGSTIRVNPSPSPPGNRPVISGKPAQLLPRLLLLAALLAVPLAGANAQAVTAEGGSIAVGGNVSNSTIGLTPEQIRDAMAAVFREESAARAEVEALSEKLNVTNEAVVTFLRILGQNQVPLEKLPETLGVIAQRHVEMLDRLAALAPGDPEINAKVEAARAAIKEGQYDRADQLLSEAEDAERAAIAMAEELAREAQAAADRRRLNAAAVRAERGEIALTQLNYLRAAGHFDLPPEEWTAGYAA